MEFVAAGAASAAVAVGAALAAVAVLAVLPAPVVAPVVAAPPLQPVADHISKRIPLGIKLGSSSLKSRARN